MIRTKPHEWLARIIDRLYDGLEWLLAVLLRVMPVLIIAYVGLVCFALWQSNHWPFALRAQTRIVELDLNGRAAIRWDVSSAALCLRAASTEALPSYSLVDEDSRTARLCGSKRRFAYVPTSSGRFEPQLSVVLGGNASLSSTNALVHISSIGSGRIVMDIDTSPSSEAAPTLIVADSATRLFEIPAPVSFSWIAGENDRSLLFPFSGTIRVGQDVNTTRHELLESGVISIYSPSGQEVGGRTVVDSIDLLPGDMVDLSAPGLENKSQTTQGTARGDRPFARGFIRIARAEMADPWPTMEVLAFGLSNYVRVHRFGEAGLSFKPGIWARLTHDNVVVTASLLLAGLLSLLASLANAMSLARRGS